MLDELKSNDNSDVFVPIGVGIFAKGNLEKVDKVLMSLGAGIVAEKDIVSAKKLLGKRKSIKKMIEEFGEKIWLPKRIP